MAKLKTRTNQPVQDEEGLLDHLSQDGNTTQVGGNLEVDGNLKLNELDLTQYIAVSYTKQEMLKVLKEIYNFMGNIIWNDEGEGCFYKTGLLYEIIVRNDIVDSHLERVILFNHSSVEVHIGESGYSFLEFVVDIGIFKNEDDTYQITSINY